jgi:hypothetical protein
MDCEQTHVRNDNTNVRYRVLLPIGVVTAS